MCGIAALFAARPGAVPGGALVAMRDLAAHRGPDDAGVTFLGPTNGGSRLGVLGPDDGWTAGLAHRRLSIIDLSAAGHQPMSIDDRWWITFNGEVYNYLELRAELEALGHSFRSGSDTEVLLRAYAEWGTASFERLRGMWGFVIVDVAAGEAIVCRDRLGIKPMYLARGDGCLAVVSELKQLGAVPGFRFRLQRDAAEAYLATGYEDPGLTLFDGVDPLPGGTWARVRLDTLAVGEPCPYWYPEKVGVSVHDPAEAAQRFERVLAESVRLHFRSDVPVGVALSGGLDSSALMALASERVDEAGDDAGPVHTFSSTFPTMRSDERPFIDAVLADRPAHPHFVTPDPNRFLADLDDFVWHHDEPVGGLSIYAGYCVARLLREHGVPVTLNGQGGDEVLGGYWQSYFMYLRQLFRQRSFGELAGHVGGSLLPGGNPHLVAQAPSLALRYASRRRGAVSAGMIEHMGGLGEQERRLYEIRTFHLPRLLKWDDRNLMAFSVEGRYPFLDHVLIEECLSFAPGTLYDRGWTKRPLRLGLDGRLPPKVARRKSKLGFPTPQDEWLAGPLRPTIERWLTDDRPVWDLVERSSAADLAATAWRWGSRRPEPGQHLFRTLVFDRWMSRFGVPA